VDAQAVLDDGVLQVHEAECLRCGRCCYAKLLVEDRVIYTDVPCRYLDTGTRLCTVYGRRHEVNPDCLDVEAGIRRGVFPADCPYVRDIPGYRPPVLDPGPGELAEFLGALEAEEVEA
jgi:uncharacterized cysteine cluster protein YcgN (CxxCxxCC family)